MAASLRTIHYSRLGAFAIGVLTGLVEPVGALLGGGLGVLSQAVLPTTLGLAAGAMLYVISHEIIPETHRRGYENLATFSLIVGLLIMRALDATLG